MHFEIKDHEVVDKHNFVVSIAFLTYFFAFHHFPKPIFKDFRPLFCLQKLSKIKKNAPKAEKVDFSKSGVLPAWEHDSEGFRPPKIIKNHKKIGLKDTLKKTMIFRPIFL